MNQLRAQPCGDITTRGGGTLVSNLIGKGSARQLHLFVNPTEIDAGMPVFPNLDAYEQLRVVTAPPFECGITAPPCEPKRSLNTAADSLRHNVAAGVLAPALSRSASGEPATADIQ